MGARGRRRTAAALLLAALLTACGSGGEPADVAASTTSRTAEDCTAVASTLVTTASRYLDGVEASSSAGLQEGSGPEPDADGSPGAVEQAQQEFTQALSDLRSYAADLGCDPASFRDEVAAGLQGLTAGGPVANAVLLQLRADADPAAARRTGPVSPSDDLAAAVAAAAAGATVELGPGEHRLTETLALLRGITLRGAGRDATTVTTGAPGGVVLVLTAEPVTLDGLTLSRPPDAPGSVVSAAPVATLSISGSRITGATADAEGDGGIGVLLAAGPGGQAGLTRRTTLRFTDSEASDNGVAGVVAGGEHRVEVSGSTVARNGQCGLCFLATSDGTVTGSTLEGNTAGLVAAGDARPVLSGTRLVGGDVAVQALGRAAPQVEAADVSGSARAAFLFGDDSAGAVRGTTCREVPVGVVVGPAAAPVLEGNTGCDPVRGQ